MSTKRNTKSDQAAETETSKTEDTNKDSVDSAEMLRLLLDRVGPLIEFHKANPGLTMDDLRINWDVRLIRGEDEPFGHLQGSSTMHRIFAPNMMTDATSTAAEEMTYKIVKPVVSIVQGYVNRVALEQLAANEAALDSEDLD